MSWNIDHSNATELPALYIQGLKDEDKPDIILTQEDRCGENEYKAKLPGSEQRDFGTMLQEQYDLTVKQLVTIVACENGETQVKVIPPKKEFLLKLIQYIDQYQNKYG